MAPRPPGGLTLASLVVALGIWACGAPTRDESPLPPLMEVPPASSPRDVAVLEVEGFGEVRVELLADLAPETVAHFERLAEQGYYDGTTFHRVVPGFMVQGGDPNTRDRDPRNDGMGGQEERVADERPALSHVRGTLSLANRGVPGSGGAQFFITVADASHLDGSHAAFGRVTEGMAVIDRIAAVERDVYGRHGPIDRPIANVALKDVRIERPPRPASREPAPKAP